jgi:HAD superfamily hydrolase (TIGR01509 family)
VPISAIIFDFDGLIIDSETPLLEIWQEIFAEHGGVLTMDEWQHALGTHGGFDPFEALAQQTGVALEQAECRQRVTREHWERCERQPLLPGVLELLGQSRALGLKAALASSSGRDWVLPWLRRHALDEHFDAICTRDDVARVKPDPELFLLAAERLGVAPGDCVVFEDSPNGIRAARAAGMLAVAVPAGLTRALPLPDPDLVVESLATHTLLEVLDALAVSGRSVGAQDFHRIRTHRPAGR